MLKWRSSTRHHAGCDFCGWETSEDRDAPEMAWGDAEELISKFPYIMRVHPGDNLLLKFNGDIFTVMDKNLYHSKLYLEDCCGDVVLVRPDEVYKWPWELEQEGGQQ